MKILIFMMFVLVFSGFVFAVDKLTEVEKKALFDIFVEIPPEYHTVGIDEKILFTLKLVNLGGAGRIDVFLEYSVVDLEGNVILNKRDTVAIETQASFLREFDLKDIPIGDYDIYAKLIYADGKEADSRHSFKIRGAKAERMQWIWVIVVIVLIIGIGGFLYPKVKMIRDKMKIRSQVREIVRESRVK